MISCAAITGGIACGKTMLERCLQARGCRILDADAVVHDLQRPDGAAYADLVAAFGKGILSPTGEIDRRKLAAEAFSDPGRRALLESLLHGRVRAVFEDWRRKANPGIIHLASIPLLYETGWEKEWPFVICICAKPEVQLRRLMCLRGMPEPDARARLAAQWPVAEKAARADYVIWNNTDEPEMLRSESDRLFHYLMENQG